LFLSVFMWNLCKCNCWLITEVILRNARCNNKVYTGRVFRLSELLYCYLKSANILRKYGTAILKVAQIRLLTGHSATLSHVQNLGFTVLGHI